MKQKNNDCPKILVIEDDEALNELIKKRLTRLGFKIEGTTEGFLGLELLTKKDYDLLILDYQLPDMSAREVLTKLDEYIPFIIITGRGDESTAVEMMKLGALDYLTKRPDFIDLLVQVVKKTMQDLNKKIELEKAYQKLKTERETKNKIIQTTIDGFFILNKKGKFIEVNNSLLEMTDYQENELLQLNLFELDIRNSSQLEKHLSKILSEGQERFETKFETKSDKVIDVEISATVIQEQQEIRIVGFVRNITFRNQTLEELKKLNQAVEQSSSIILITDKEGQIEYVNPQFEEVTGYNLSEVKGENPRILKSGQVSEEEYQKLWDKISSGQEWRGEFYNQKKNGEYYWELASIAPIHNSNDQITGFVKTAEDISMRKEKEAKIKYINYHDALTNLYNRKYYEKKLEELDSKKNLPLSLVIGDLNGLKLVNDVFGHEAGDDLLKETAQILKESVRSEDIIARWGGDEFGIILPQTGRQEAKEIINRIKSKCSQSQFKPLPPFVALGTATKIDKQQNLQKIFKKSEDRMYQDKQQQKDDSDNPLLKRIISDLEETNHMIVDSIIKLLFFTEEQSLLEISEYEMEALFLLARFHDLGKLIVNQ